MSFCKSHIPFSFNTVYPKKYALGYCFAVTCCGYTLTDFPISIRLTSLALWQSNDCPSASKATLMNMDNYFTWIHYEWLHNHNKAKHNKTVCIFLGIYCRSGKRKYSVTFGNSQIIHYFQRPVVTVGRGCNSGQTMANRFNQIDLAVFYKQVHKQVNLTFYAHHVFLEK